MDYRDASAFTHALEITILATEMNFPVEIDDFSYSLKSIGLWNTNENQS